MTDKLHAQGRTRRQTVGIPLATRSRRRQSRRMNGISARDGSVSGYSSTATLCTTLDSNTPEHPLLVPLNELLSRLLIPIRVPHLSVVTPALLLAIFESLLQTRFDIGDKRRTHVAMFLLEAVSETLLTSTDAVDLAERINQTEARDVAHGKVDAVAALVKGLLAIAARMTSPPPASTSRASSPPTPTRARITAIRQILTSPAPSDRSHSSATTVVCSSPAPITPRHQLRLQGLARAQSERPSPPLTPPLFVPPTNTDTGAWTVRKPMPIRRAVVNDLFGSARLQREDDASYEKRSTPSRKSRGERALREPKSQTRRSSHARKEREQDCDCAEASSPSSHNDSGSASVRPSASASASTSDDAQTQDGCTCEQDATTLPTGIQQSQMRSQAEPQVKPHATHSPSGQWSPASAIATTASSTPHARPRTRARPRSILVERTRSPPAVQTQQSSPRRRPVTQTRALALAAAAATPNSSGLEAAQTDTDTDYLSLVGESEVEAFERERERERLERDSCLCSRTQVHGSTEAKWSDSRREGPNVSSRGQDEETQGGPVANLRERGDEGTDVAGAYKRLLLSQRDKLARRVEELKLLRAASGVRRE